MSEIQKCVTFSNIHFFTIVLLQIHSVFFISTHFIRNQAEICQKIKKVLRKCPASKSQDFKKFSASDSGNFFRNIQPQIT